MNIKTKITNYLSALGKSTIKGSVEQANEEFNYLMGESAYANKRPDTRTRKLYNVDEVDAPILKDLGAEQKEDGFWYVPKKVSMKNFQPWWKDIPEDVIVNNDEMRTTANGESFNAHTLKMDTLTGDDSTATSINMVLFPILGAFVAMVAHIPFIGGLLAFVSLFGLIPLVISLFESEGFGKTLICMVLFLGVVMSGTGTISEVPGLASMLSMMHSHLTGAGVIAGIVLLGMFLFPNKKHTMTHFQSFVDRLPIAGAIVGILIANYALMLGLAFIGLGAWAMALGPSIFISLVACAYPMIYTEGNYKERSSTLYQQGQKNQGSVILDKNVDKDAIEAHLKNAMYDETPLINVGVSRGYLSGKKYKKGYKAGKVIKLSLNDLSMHTLTFGQTGSGKTSNILRPMAGQLSALRDPDGSPSVGIMFSDGKEAFPEEVRGVIDIMVEKGLDYAPFEGLTPINIATVMADNSAVSLDDDKNALWSQGAFTLHQQLLTILDALVKNQERVIKVAKKNVVQVEQYIDILITEKVMLERKIAGADTISNDERMAARPVPELHKLDGSTKQKIDELLEEIEKYETVKDILLENALPEKLWHWTPYDYNTIKNMFSNVRMTSDEEAILSKDASRALAELGYKATEERQQYYPETIHPDLHKEGLPLSNALIYFTKEWVELDKEQRTSFLLNVNNDIMQFMQNGNVMCNAEGTPWSMIEHGENLEQVLYGKKLGINVPENKYGKGGKMVAKMVKQRIYNAIKKRSEYGNDWKTDLKGQKPVIDMMDECQNFVSRLELELLPKARSLGLWAIFATQQFGEFMRVFQEKANSAGSLVETFQNVISFKSSTSTFEFLQKRAGEAKMLKTGMDDNTRLIDPDQVADAWYNSPAGMEHHSSEAYFDKITRRGGLTLIAKSDLDNKLGYSASFNSRNYRKDARLYQQGKHNMIILNDRPKYEARPVVELDEFKSNTDIQGGALFILNRANMMRVEYGNGLYCEEEDIERFKSIDRPMGELLVAKYYEGKRED